MFTDGHHSDITSWKNVSPHSSPPDEYRAQSQNLSSDDRKQPNVYLWIWYPPNYRTPKRTKHSSLFFLFSYFFSFFSLSPLPFFSFFPFSFFYISIPSVSNDVMFHDTLSCFYSRIKISKGRFYTVLMHITVFARVICALFFLFWPLKNWCE